MWTTQETKRYEEHLEKHWTRKGKKIPQKYRPSLRLDSPEMIEAMAQTQKEMNALLNEPSPLMYMFRNNV